jgi:hypothetical protein
MEVIPFVSVELIGRTVCPASCAHYSQPLLDPQRPSPSDVAEIGAVDLALSGLRLLRNRITVGIEEDQAGALFFAKAQGDAGLAIRVEDRQSRTVGADPYRDARRPVHIVDGDSRALFTDPEHNAGVALIVNNAKLLRLDDGGDLLDGFIRHSWG